MDRGKRTSNQGTRRTAASGRTSRTSTTSRTSRTSSTSRASTTSRTSRASTTSRTSRALSSSSRREPSESSNARSRSRSQREQQQPSSQSAPIQAPTVPVAAATPAPAPAPAAPIIDDGPSNSTQAPADDGVHQRSTMDTYNDVMMLLEHFDELMNMLNNPGGAAMSAECLSAMARLYDDFSRLLQQPSGQNAFAWTPAVSAAAPNSGQQAPDGVDQQRSPMATFNDLVILVARFDEIVNLLSNPEETFMSGDTLDAMARLFNDLTRLLRYVSGCLHRLPINADPGDVDDESSQ